MLALALLLIGVPVMVLVWAVRRRWASLLELVVAFIWPGAKDDVLAVITAAVIVLVYERMI